MEITKKAKTRLIAINKQIKEQPRLFAHQADCYLLLGKYKQAAKILNQGLEKFPTSVVGWLVKGNLHICLKQHKLAYAAFKQVLKIDNNITSAHEMCVELTEEEGDNKKYIQHLRELKRLDPIDDSYQGRLDTALLRLAAVEHGLYTEDRVVNISSKMLRRTLLEHNLIPPEIERKKERYYMSEVSELQPTTEAQDKMLDKATEYASEYITDEAEGVGNEELTGAWDAEETLEGKLDSAGSEVLDEDKSKSEPAISEEDSAEEDEVSRESPLMRLLRGEMEEHPTTREVKFTTEGETADESAYSDASSLPSDKAGVEIGSKIDADELKRLEEDQRRLARIAREVTGIAAKPKPDALEPTPEISDEVVTTKEPSVDTVTESLEEPEKEPPEKTMEAEPVDTTDDDAVVAPVWDEEVAEKEAAVVEEAEEQPTSEMEQEIVEEPPVVAEESVTAQETDEEITPSWEKEVTAEAVDDVTSKPEEAERETKPVLDEDKETETKGRIPTKTLAELYASQGDIREAIKVYEELLKKHPANKSYRKRIDELKAQL